MKHLGERFDIHTGGNDNKFPHHEDEIAQSEGAVGHEVVVHLGARRLPQMAGQKMAKSAKNIYRVTDLADHGIDPLAYRLLCFGSRYRSGDGLLLGGARGRARARSRTLRQRMADWAGTAHRRRDAGRLERSAARSTGGSAPRSRTTSTCRPRWW